MSKTFSVSYDELIHQLKLNCRISPTIEEIVTRKIIEHTAVEKDLQVKTDELQQAADNLRLISNLWSADATWSWLKKNNLSLDNFEEMVYATALYAKLAEHLFANEIEPFFVEHQLDYAQVVMYEVVLDDQDLAMELFYSLQEGEVSFYELAHQYIQNIELRRSGGYRGILHRTELKPEISAAVFAASPPQLLKPIITSKGAHLILVEDLIQPQLDDVLRNKILSDLFSAWLKEQLEQVEIITQFDQSN